MLRGIQTKPMLSLSRVRLPVLMSLVVVVLALAAWSPTTTTLVHAAETKTRPAAEARVEGDKAMAAGKIPEAIKLFTEAIDGEADNFVNWYKRAAAALLGKRYRSALHDLSRVVELNPDYVMARKLRAKIALAQGLLNTAEEDARAVLKADGSDATAKKQLQDVALCQSSLDAARSQMGGKQWQAAVDSLTKAMEVASNSIDLRLMRAKAYLELGNNYGAQADASAVVRMQPALNEAILIKSTALYRSNEFEKALDALRAGLRGDPDNKELKKPYRKIKQLVKRTDKAREAFKASKYREALELYDMALKVDPTLKKHNAELQLDVCRAHNKLGQAKEAVEACNRALELDAERWEPLVERAKARLALEEYEEAVNDYTQAQSKEPNNGDIQQGLHDAQHQLRLSKRKNYYKILGVSKQATKREIKKRYRLLARTEHPDKHPNNREAAVKKFRDITEAYEILTDEEKRGRYDRGEDLDEQQMGGGGNPFQGGGFPFGDFGGGGGNFHFRFG